MNVEMLYSGVLLNIGNENIWLGVIGLISTLLGIFVNRIQITPEVQKTKLESEKLEQQNIQFLFERFKEDNSLLKEELKTIKEEIKMIENEYEQQEKELEEQITKLKEDLEFANKLVEALEDEITDLKNTLQAKEELLKENKKTT